MKGLQGHDEPRIWTPPLRPLTKHTTLGFEAVKFAADVLLAPLFPWQAWLLIHGLELDPDYTTADPNPLFRFDTVLVLAARQNGKTEAMKVLALWKVYLDREAFGTTVIGTAQDLRNSEKAWEQAVDWAETVDDLSAEIRHVDKTNGKKSLRLQGRHQYMVAAASRRGARGFTGDLVMLDELREHQTWDSWAASTKTTLARPRSQVWAFSNAGDAASIVLWHLRAQALQAATGVEAGELEAFTGPGVLVEPDDDDVEPSSVGIFEWSSPPKLSIWDRSGWEQANPSLGKSITERKIAAAARTDPEWVFRTEVLCQWRPTAAGGPFPDGAWDAGIDLASRIGPDSPIGVCIDVAADRGMSYIAMAGFRTDGDLHVEMVAARAGTEWVLPWLTSADRFGRDRWTGVAWQLSGAPVSSLTDSLRAIGEPASTLTAARRATVLPLMEWAASDLPRGHGQMYDLVREPKKDEVGKLRVWHVPQPVLDVPASTGTTRPLGDGWVLDRRKSPSDVAPLIAAIGACWVLAPRPDEEVMRPEIHEWPDDILEAAADGKDPRLVESFTGG
jgi:hypothetical protein